MLNKFSQILSNKDGAIAIMFAIVIVPIILAIGASIDYVRAYNSRSQLQGASDAAVLSTAANYTSDTTLEAITDRISVYLATNGPDGGELDGDPEISDDNTELCITAKETVPMTFMTIVGIDSQIVRVNSCSTLPDLTEIEISLVLDVSSSMVEENRFAPMQEAVQGFISSFSNNTNLKSRTRIAIVPFSSRVNIGMSHTDWLRSYDGYDAIPARWQDPEDYYGSSRSYKDWVDGETVNAYTSSNDYWMGCIEPRSDVEVNDVGEVSNYGLTDEPPGSSTTVSDEDGNDVTISSSLVAMDSNPKSSTSFCPPPITSLNSDFSYLSGVASNLTSDGSTRLDTGMIAGWYTLSPKWRGYWDSSDYPADYASTVKKYLVFMTDGEMNTKYKSKSSKFDWLCTGNESKSKCNDLATDNMLDICKSIKAKGIDIYTVAYGKDADVTNLKSCATGTDHFVAASEDSSSTSYITTIYQSIADEIGQDIVRLTQ